MSLDCRQDNPRKGEGRVDWYVLARICSIAMTEELMPTAATIILSGTVVIAATIDFFFFAACAAVSVRVCKKWGWGNQSTV